LYVQNLSLYISRFREGKVSYSTRTSRDKSGAVVGHVSFSLAGRVYELVGEPVDDGKDWIAWSDAECAAAHSLEQTLAFYADAVSQAYPSTYGHEFGEMLIVGISMSHHDPWSNTTTSTDRSTSTLYDHLAKLAGGRVNKYYASSAAQCEISEIRFESMPGLVTRYVNNVSPGLKLVNGSVYDYDEYAAALHRTFSISRPSRYGGEWYGWDHMLDQHLGLWYSGQPEECLQRASLARSLLHTAGLGVGERGQEDAHEMYVGYSGSMAWEYQWQHCNASRPAAPAECACIASNNIEDYEHATNQTTCQRVASHGLDIVV